MAYTSYGTYATSLGSSEGLMDTVVRCIVVSYDFPTALQNASI